MDSSKETNSTISMVSQFPKNNKRKRGHDEGGEQEEEKYLPNEGGGTTGGEGGDIKSLRDIAALQEQLSAAKESIIHVFNEVTIASVMDECWNKLPQILKNDPQIAGAAASRRRCSLEELSDSVKRNPLFWKQLLPKAPCFGWNRIPKEIVNKQFVMSIQYKNERLAAEGFWFAMKHFPTLRKERELWANNLHLDFKPSIHAERLTGVIQEMAPPSIKNDKELMLPAVQNDPSVLTIVGEELKLDLELIKASIDKDGLRHGLQYVSAKAQRQHIDLVCQIWETKGSCSRDYIAKDLWQNKKVVLAWYRGGGHLLDAKSSCIHDKDVLLEIASTRKKHGTTAFKRAPKEFKNNKEFMMEAVTRNPLLFLQAPPNLQKDFDLALTALANTCAANVLDLYNQIQAKNVQWLRNLPREIWNEVDARLQRHKEFLVFLFGMSGRAGSQCPLRLFSSGYGTTVGGFERIIAEFLGAPVGKQYLLCRQAQRNGRELELGY